MAASELGDYLRARRAQLRPDEVNLPTSGTRRVPGLRREEVALLVGLSVDYYVRLEQGRERGPSAQVVDALATALRLDEDGRLHLFRLAGLSPRARAAAVADRVDPSLLQLMDAWPDNPAIIYNRAYDVLAANAIADALFHEWTHSRNLMHMVFTDPAARKFYVDWHDVARNSVAGFRLGYGAARKTRESSRFSPNYGTAVPNSRSCGPPTTRGEKPWRASASSTTPSAR